LNDFRWLRSFRRTAGRLRSLRDGTRFRYALASLLSLLPFLSASPAFAQGDYALLTFLHTNDLHGRVVSGKEFEDDSRGGLARAATLVRELKTQLPHVLFVDSGDLIHGSPVEFLSRGRSMIEAMNAAGVDVSCPGNHEFDWGQDAAGDAMKLARFPWVSANIVERDTGLPFPPLQPYRIMDAGGVKVAFFGLTTLETVDLEWPPFLSRIRFLDPIQTAKALVPQLRQQADLVVLLSHLGAAQDELLAAQVPGIDLILGSHSHTTLRQRVEVNGTIIAQTGYYGQNLGRVDLIMKRDGEGRWRLDSLNGRGGLWWRKNSIRPLNLDYPDSALLPLGPAIPPDPAVVDAYRTWEDRWRDLRDSTLGEATAPITDRDAPGDAPGDTPLSRFLADELRAATGADLALVDGKWTGGLPKGDVPASAVWNSMGGYTGQNILRFRATGARIRRFLDQWGGLPGGLAVGVSGLTATVDPREPEGRRVVEAEIDGKALDDAATYSVAGVMYVVRRFPALMEAAPQKIDGPVEWSRPLILEAAKEQGRFEPDPVPRLTLQPNAGGAVGSSGSVTDGLPENP
jgi:5'-nucleotidase